MSISPLPNGRFRVQIPRPGDRPVALSKLLTRSEELARKFNDPKARGGTYANAKQAAVAEQVGLDLVATRSISIVTVKEWRERWLADPLFIGAKKQATIRKWESDTRGFVARYGHLALTDVDHGIVAEWLRGAKNINTIPALSSMWTHAKKPTAGRLVDSNPWYGLGLDARNDGNHGVFPPDLNEMARLLELAQHLAVCPPSYAAWLEFGKETGMRCGEIDYVRFEDIEDGEVDVQWQFNQQNQRERPKYGPYRAVLTDRAAEIVREQRAMSRNGVHVFETLKGEHWSTEARRGPWERLRTVFLLDPLGDRFCAGKEQAGETSRVPLTQYLATRHHFGWYAFNILDMDAAKVGECLGHKDGGKLVYDLYGHRDETKRRGQVREAARLERQRRLGGRHLEIVSEDEAAA
jgi:integrase